MKRHSAVSIVLLLFAALLTCFIGCSSSSRNGGSDGEANTQSSREKIAPGKAVWLAYTMSDESGKVWETVSQREPFAFLHGRGAIFPALEEALVGKSTGDSCRVELSPNEAFGRRDEALVKTLPRSQIDVDEIHIGMQLHGIDDTSSPWIVTAITDDAVTVDRNHPLAGKTVIYEISVLNVREATPKEVAHGHVHGLGGVEH